MIRQCRKRSEETVVLEAQGNKLTLKDIVYIVAIVFTCILLIFTHLKYINVVCVLDVMICVFGVLVITARIFLWKVKWFVVGFGKKVIIYNEKKIDEKVKENEGR